MASVAVKGFVGGLVDEYVGAPLNKWQIADNLVVTSDREMQSRPGCNLDFEGENSRVSEDTGSRRIGLAIPAYGTIFKQVVKSLQYHNGTSLVELFGPSGAQAFSTVASPEVAFCFSNWNGHQFITHDDLTQRVVKIYGEDSNASQMRLRTSGLPKPEGVPTFQGEAGAGSDRYVYAFVYKYTYVVDGVTFVDRSAPLYVTRDNVTTAATGVNVANLELFNGTGDHYDVDSEQLVIEVYRTAANGTVFYLIWDGTDPVTSQNPNAGIIAVDWSNTNLPLYTTGGVAENDQPPICKYVHMTSGFGYYAHGIDPNSGEVIKSILWQSKPADPDSVPSRFNVEIEGEITGISSVRSIPIVFTRDEIYRIDGFFDASGRGGMNPIKISDTTGSVSQLSMVQTLDWLYFAGKDGFYRTNGYDVQSLSDNAQNKFTAQYKTFVGSSLKEKRICGAYHDSEKRVLWAVQGDSPENPTDNNKLMVFDLRFGVFTSWSSGWMDDAAGRYSSQFVGNFRPTALAVLRDVFNRCDYEGYNFVYSSGTLSDPKIDTSEPDTTAWGRNPIIYNLKTASTDFNLPEVRKWVETLIFKGKSVIDSNVRLATNFNTSLQVRTDNDDKQSFTDFSEIVRRNQLTWGQAGYVWGDPEIWQSSYGMVIQKRFFPQSGGLRCSYKQLQFTNLFANVANSDTYGVAEISGSNIQMPVISITGDVTSGSDEITNVSDTAGLDVGMGIAGTGIPDGTLILSFDEDTATIVLTADATATNAGVSLSIAKLFPHDPIDYWMTFAIDNYVAEYRVLSVAGTPNGSMITVDGTPPVNPSNKWVMKGFIKGDAICIVEFVMNYAPMSDTQNVYRGKYNANDQGGTLQTDVAEDASGDCLVFDDGVD